MNAILSIVFGFLFLLQAVTPNMDLCCELPKIPALFEHYQEHEAHDGTSFVEFLDYHYGGGQDLQKHHHDDEHDSNLPFHGEHQCCHGYVFIASLGQADVATLHDFIQTKASVYTFSVSTQFFESPFQPPKS